jgi:aminopeptidase-like protein
MDAKVSLSQSQEAQGRRLFEFAARLYPICRSITGAGVRETLQLIGARIPLVTHEVRSGTRLFDWEVPPEWNIEDASVSNADGRRVIDFRKHNLHLVSYSEPVRTTLSRAELLKRVHVLTEHPDWIPYRTSYYERTWGFCMSARERDALPEGRYRIEVRSSLAPGSLTYGELAIRGATRSEVLFFTHVCHPSLANDNTSGMAVATALAEWIAREPRRFTYRFVFAPGTIGSLAWLKANQGALKRIRHGLVLALLGDPGNLTYKKTRQEDREIDAVAAYVLAHRGRLVPFSPYGYDERQLCSPGFDLPVGRLTRSVNGGYPQYHTSADNLEFIRPQALADSLQACQDMVEVIEGNERYLNRSPKGEPRLGKRGLYGSLGGRGPLEREHALLWVLNQSDGLHSLLDIAQRSGLKFAALQAAAAELKTARLLGVPTRGKVRSRSAGRPPSTPRGRRKA